jgi:hypothetical protein
MPKTSRAFTARLVFVATLLTAVLAWPAGFLRARQQSDSDTRTLRMIVVSSADVAERIRARVTSGESFAVIARTESTDATGAVGGWLGRMSTSALRPEVRAALEGLSPGAVTDVVRLPIGFALFRVEEDEPAASDAAEIAAGLAASGAVRFVYDFGGFTEARASLEAHARSSAWRMDSQAACDARTEALATTHRLVEEFFASGDRSSKSSLDLMQLHVGLAQLDAYEGRMDRAISRLHEARKIAMFGVPEAVLQMEQALGIAHLHKAGLENHVHETPGELCLLDPSNPHPYPATDDVERAVAHFTTYLESQPGNLEVRWLLNIAHMAQGTYPDSVPARHLLPPSAFASKENVGRFRDVAQQVGLISIGSAGGVIVEDLHNQGRFDVVTSMSESCGPMRLLSNNGDGTFSDRTYGSGLDAQLGGLNLVQGDVNNDGCPDVLVMRGGWEELPQRRSLLQNNCRGGFTDVTAQAGLALPATASQTAVFADIDNDGWLDLFVGNENAPAQLFRNTGDGRFVDISAAAGVNRVAYTKGVTAADYDNDGFIDLYVSNYGGDNFLYRNNRNGTFTEFAQAARVAGTPTGFATWFFDYNNDGHQDLFVTSYIASLDEMARHLLAMPRQGTTMKLYRNMGDGTFRDATREAGLERVLMPMGANFGDIDNDGWLDMYLGTGNPSYASLAGSVLLRNVDGRRFVDVTASSGTGELHRGHGVAFADMDNDGDQDIVFEVGGITPGDRHALRLFENPGHGNDWLAVKLVGVKTNRSAVGARVTVTVEDAAGARRSIHRAVTTGGSFGVSPLEQHIGLGRDARVVDVEVWWPASDTRQRFTGVPKNQWIQIEEFATGYTTQDRKRVVLGGKDARW